MPYHRKISSEHVGATDAETARNAGVSKAAVGQARVRTKAGRESMEAAVLRKETALANLRETEAALAMGEAVSVGDYRRVLAAMIGAARGKLLPLGAKIGPVVASLSSTAECVALIDREVHAALNELVLTDVSDFTGSEEEAGERESLADAALGSAA